MRPYMQSGHWSSWTMKFRTLLLADEFKLLEKRTNLVAIITQLAVSSARITA